MTDLRQSWVELGSRLEELGLKLQLHVEQAGGEPAPASEADESALKDALHTVSAAVDQAFTALGSAARDDAVRDDLKDVGRSVVEALDATIAELGERLRSVARSG